jgi:hypothetical protein
MNLIIRLFMIRKIFGTISVVASSLLMFYGLIELVVKVNETTKSFYLTMGTIGLILIIFVGSFVYHLARPRVLKEFGIGRYETEIICLENIHDIRIQENYQVKVSVQRRLVFMKTPIQTDMVDFYSTDPQHSLESFPYNSLDAEEVDRKQQAQNRIAIFWRPKKPIYPYTEYVHQDSWIPSVLLKPPADYIEYHCDVKTGIYKATVHSPVDIERAVAFKRPRWKLLNNDFRLVKYSLAATNRGCPQPNVSAEKKELSWEIINPTAGEDYVLVFFYQGGIEYWRSQISHKKLINKLKSKIQSLAAKIHRFKSC